MVSPPYYLLLALGSSHHSKYITAVPVVVTQWRCLLTSHMSHQLTISTHYLHIICSISTHYLLDAENSRVWLRTGASVWWGPARARLTTDCEQTPGPRLWISTHYLQYLQYLQHLPRTGGGKAAAHSPLQQQLLNEFNFSSEMWRDFQGVVVNMSSLFFLAPSQERGLVSCIYTSLLSLPWQVNKDNIMMMEHC